MIKNGAATRSCIDDVGPKAFQRIAVIGAGAWGTALALTAHRAGREVVLWAREGEVVDAIVRTCRNPFLPNVEIPKTITATDDLERALAKAQLVVLASPSQHLRSIARRVEAALPRGVPVVICSKGVEAYTGLLMSQVVAAEMPGRPQAVLSGPTFAAEVAERMPTAATVAAPTGEDGFHDTQLAVRVATTFATPEFRPYLSNDVAGVEIGGAAKNVLAIACGVAAGRGMGSNTQAALIARGLAEIIRLGQAVGARVETLCGLAGAGDLMLTCSSEQSRNFAYGKALGEGRNSAKAGRSSRAWRTRHRSCAWPPMSASKCRSAPLWNRCCAGSASTRSRRG
ncbi:MAG TPA: NAD(P)H-dependent glycerol-3-phosphate dehydrogenase [Caulobacteraceae bacterium]